MRVLWIPYNTPIMKSLLLLFSCVALALVAESRNGLRSTTSSVPIIYPHFTIEQGGINGSPINLSNSRIVAFAAFRYLNGAYEPWDSTTYHYSFGRGGQLDAELNDDFIRFDESVTYAYSSGLSQFIPSARRLQDYLGDGSVLAYTQQTWNKITNVWDNDRRWAYSYIAPNKVENTDFELWYGSLGWVPHVYYQNTFNSLDQLVAMNSNVYRIDFAYNPGGNLEQQIEQVKNPVNGPFVNYKRTTTSYIGATQKVQSETIEDWDGSLWLLSSKDSIIYSGSLVAEKLTAVWNNGNWQPTTRVIFNYDGNGNNIERVTQAWNQNTFANVRKVVQTFNQFSQPTIYQSVSWRNNAWVVADSDVLYRAYYETFNPAGVNTSVRSENISIYPVPANEEVNVGYEQKGDRIIRICLLDVQGQVLDSRDGTDYASEVTFNTSNLPSGAYLIQIVTTSNQLTRLIQVAH